MKLVKNTLIILVVFSFLLFFIRGSSRFTGQTSSFSPETSVTALTRIIILLSLVSLWDLHLRETFFLAFLFQEGSPRVSSEVVYNLIQSGALTAHDVSNAGMSPKTLPGTRLVKFLTNILSGVGLIRTFDDI
jgi:hypothetical protein